MGCKDEEHTLKSVGDTAGKVDANTVTGGYTASAGTQRGKGRLRMGGQASLPRQGHLSWVLRDEKGVCPMVEAGNNGEAYNICYEERTRTLGR